LRATLQAELVEQYEFVGGGPFCSFQVDMTSTLNTSYCAASVSFVNKRHEHRRISLATRAFPGTHTAADVSPWITA
ncbi:unnamed protein product, partial [Phaeothamnion confervicola]